MTGRTLVRQSMTGFGGAELAATVSRLAIVLLLATATAGWAQDAAKDSDLPLDQEVSGTSTEDTDSGAIVVTGTNISGVKPVGSETIAINRSQILATGLTDVAAVLQTVPQVQNNPNAGGQVFRQGGTSLYGSAAGGGGNSTQGTAINIRGIGTSATLTLVDGRRVVPSGASNAFTEAVQVPIAALERIEVVTDGNSAIYGSDAISGVVNYVLRKNFDGVEVTGRDTYSRFYNEWGASVTAGKTWGTGNIILTYDYDHRGSFRSSQSEFLRSDLRPLGGPDQRALNGTVSAAGPTLIVGGNGVPYSYYTIPGSAQAGTTFAQLTPGANVLDPDEYNEYLGRQTRHQVAAFANQELTPELSLYFEGFFSRRRTSTQSYDNSLSGNNVVVCQGSPYYIDGAPPGAAAPNSNCPFGGLGQTVAINPIVFYGGPTITENPDTTYTLTGGFTWSLPSSWKAEGYFTYGHDKTCGICNYDNNANASALAAQITAGAINPYSDVPLSDAQRATFLGSNLQFSSNDFQDAVLKFDGPLFLLPAGDVRAAFGGEYSYNRQHLLNESNTAFPDDPTNNTFAVTNSTTVHRNVKSVFAELFVPLVSDDMGVPLVQSLSLDGAVRYDKYSDFGSTTNPKFGATWTVNDDFSIRGSWGTSFRAPALTDTNLNNFSAALIGVPVANSIPSIPNIPFIPGNASAYQAIGANPTLQPETATSWSAGFDFRPHTFPGLRFSTTYYNLEYKNQIVGPPTGSFLTSQENFDLYGKYIIPVSNNPATCVNGDASTYDPVLANFIAASPALYRISILGACSVSVIIDGRSTNAATTFQDGLDFQLSYSFTRGRNIWSLSANVTKILNQKLQQVKGGQKSDVLDTYYYPISWRGRGQLGWTDGRLGANLFLNYVGPYNNTIPVAGTAPSGIRSWATWDLGLSYQITQNDGPAWLRGIRASLNIINLFDQDPPRVLTQAGNGFAAYDASNANIYGRFATIQFTKDF